jgi:hypothetical protein
MMWGMELAEKEVAARVAFPTALRGQQSNAREPLALTQFTLMSSTSQLHLSLPFSRLPFDTVV